MADPTWPAAPFRQTPDYGGWSETPQKNVIGFQPEVGAPKLRRRSTAAGTVADANFTLNDADLATFWTFYETTCKDGSLPFLWNHPVTGVQYRWTFDSDQQPMENSFDFGFHHLTLRLHRLP